VGVGRFGDLLSSPARTFVRILAATRIPRMVRRSLRAPYIDIFHVCSFLLCETGVEYNAILMEVITILLLLQYHKKKVNNLD